MTQTFEKNQLDMEFQQKNLMLMGVDVKNMQKKLSPQEISKMKQDYYGMYYAFTSINWGQGMTLGMAWQKALTQMDGFVASKMKIYNHPVNNHLVKIHSEFRREMARHIMTSEYANEKLAERNKKSFLDYGNKRLTETMGSLNNVYQKYMPKQEIKQPLTVKFEFAKQKAQQMLLYQQINQRAA